MGGNPENSAVSLYSPGSMPPKVKRPWSSVLTSRRDESARRRRRTVAPETANPWGSARLPERPEATDFRDAGDCAASGDGTQARESNRKLDRRKNSEERPNNFMHSPRGTPHSENGAEMEFR